MRLEAFDAEFSEAVEALPNSFEFFSFLHRNNTTSFRWNTWGESPLVLYCSQSNHLNFYDSCDSLTVYFKGLSQELKLDGMPLYHGKITIFEREPDLVFRVIIDKRMEWVSRAYVLKPTGYAVFNAALYKKFFQESFLK